MYDEKPRNSCRVCGIGSVHGWLGLCLACSEATQRFWNSRREGLKALRAKNHPKG